MTTIIKDDFSTKLGTVRTFLLSDGPDPFAMTGNFSAITLGHKITLETFELQNDWIPVTMEFETSIGWRWFIQKTNDELENLTLYCKLIDPTPDLTWGPDSGENLDAIEIENKSHQLHIGTEDGEIMQSRAETNDWMPIRLKNEIGIGKSFTEYIDFGFKTTIPALSDHEKIYFHFLVATNSIKQSIQYPDERDVSTWYAVEQTKKYLDKYLEPK